MRTMQICLALNEKDYGVALARSLLRINRLFSIGHDADEPYDLMLTDEPTMSGEKIVYFTDEKRLERIDEAHRIFIIYKYQHVRSISKILRLAYSVYTDVEMLSDAFEEVNILSVCSFAGGTGCTSVAMGLSLELARFHNRSVLYLSLEEFESTRLHFTEDAAGDRNITRYLFQLFHGDKAKRPSTAGYLCQNEYGVSAFRPSRGRNPLRELDARQFVTFMNGLLGEKMLTDVVVDCGNGLDDAILSALSLSGCVCHVAGKQLDPGRRAAYVQTASDRTGDKMRAGWVEVQNFHEPFFDDDPTAMWEQDQNLVIINRSDSCLSQTDGKIHISMDKTFGQGIGNLFSRIPLP